MIYAIFYVILFLFDAVDANVRILPYRDKFTAIEGGHLSAVKCSSGCRRACTYTWHRVSPYDEEIRTASQTLFGRKAKMDDNGKYVCQVKERWRKTQRSEEFEVIVKEANIPEVSVGDQPNTTLHQGETFYLRVYMESTLNTNITLFKNGKEMKTLEAGKASHDFIFKKVDCNDTGWYRVKASNHIGQSWSEIVTLNVICDSSLITNDTAEKKDHYTVTPDMKINKQTPPDTLVGSVSQVSKNNHMANEQTSPFTVKESVTWESKKDIVSNESTSTVTLKRHVPKESKNDIMSNEPTSPVTLNRTVHQESKNDNMVNEPTSPVTLKGSVTGESKNDNMTNEPTSPVTLNGSIRPESKNDNMANPAYKQSKSIDENGGVTPTGNVWKHAGVVGAFIAGVICGILILIAVKRIRRRLYIFDIASRHGEISDRIDTGSRHDEVSDTAESAFRFGDESDMAYKSSRNVGGSAEISVAENVKIQTEGVDTRTNIYDNTEESVYEETSSRVKCVRFMEKELQIMDDAEHFNSKETERNVYLETSV